MATYPLQNIKIGANTYTLPVPKSYSISVGTSTPISSWSSSGETLNLTGFKDQNGNAVSDASVLIPNNGAVSLKADLYVNGSQYDVQLNSIIPDGSGYKIIFFTKEFYIECNTDGHSLMNPKGYPYSGGGSQPTTDTVVLRVTAGSYPVQRILPSHADLEQASWANNGNTAAEIDAINACFYNTNGQTKKHLVLELQYKYQNVIKYYPCDVVNTFVDGNNKYGLIMISDSGSIFGQWFALTSSYGVDFRTQGPN